MNQRPLIPFSSARYLPHALGLALALVCNSALSQPSQFYQNDGLFVAPPAIPPNIDAISFINNGRFIINFTNGIIPELPPGIGLPPYETQDTRNYTNLFGKFMSCNPGFRFDTYNAQTSLRQPASTFYNAGTINCGTLDTSNYIVASEQLFGPTNLIIRGAIGLQTVSVAGSQFLVDATNVAMPGVVNMGFESLFSVHGSSVDLTRSTVNSELSGFSIGTGGNTDYIYNQGIFDGYWNIGNVRDQILEFYPFGISPAGFFGIPPPITPVHPVTNRYYQVFVTELVLSNALSYVSDVTDFSGSNRVVQVAFVQNTNANVQANVYISPTAFDIIVEFTNTLGGTIGAGTNLFGGTNNLYVWDEFYLLTNFSLVINGAAGNNFTFQPYDYLVFEIPPAFLGFLGTPVSPGPVPLGTFNANPVTNQWQAYQALLLPYSIPLTDTASQDPTNLPGRIEITADKFLNLSQARLTALNYLSLQATNHFGGSGKAQIQAPLMDINLRSTNGTMNVTNLLIPQVNRPEGHIELYSARWTNVVIGPPTVTNKYHVLFCDAHFSPNSPPRVQNLTLKSAGGGPGADSLFFSDAVFVEKSLLLDANRITIATNAPGSPTASGSLFIESPEIIWPASTPRLQYFTNNGYFQAQNTVFFGGSRGSPYYTSNFNEPYYAFVNTGSVTNFSSLIWATNFQNSGTFFATGGDIQLQLCRSALLTNGIFLAYGGQISLATRDLIVSNHLMQAGAALTLYTTNILDDGSLASESADYVTNKNTWNVNNGFNLPIKPAQGSLLATTVTNIDQTFFEVLNTWAGSDMGNTPAGFTSSNSALGRLILAGQDADSLFTFTGTGPSSNALYVDYFEMEGSLVTNRDVAGNFLGVQINPGMKIYYGQAVAGGVSVAEKLNGKNGGGFVWVSNFNTGFYSSTNVVYPDGTTNRLNTALVQSCDIDSNTNGIVNCLDPAPIFIFGPTTLSLSVAVTNTPQHKAVVSWNTVPNGTNFVYWKASMVGTNWQVLTNFVSGPVGGRVSVMDGIGQGVRLYRVRVDAPK